MKKTVFTVFGYVLLCFTTMLLVEIMSVGLSDWEVSRGYQHGLLPFWCEGAYIYIFCQSTFGYLLGGLFAVACYLIKHGYTKLWINLTIGIIFIVLSFIDVTMLYNGVVDEELFNFKSLSVGIYTLLGLYMMRNKIE